MPIFQQTELPVQLNNPSQNGSGFPNEKPQDFFSYCVGDILSMVAKPMSHLSRWIPSNPTTEWVKTVGHLSFVAGAGFTGAESYQEHIATEDPPDMCNFGDTGIEYNICEYKHEVKRVSLSNKDRPLNFFSDGGIKYCDRQPRLVIRGDTAGMQIDTDRQWILSGLTSRLQSHLEWNKYWGRDSMVTSPGSYEGLRAILTPGWVKNHKQGSGSCIFTDPLVYSGVNLDTAELLYRKIRFYVRKIIWRMVSRGYNPSSSDMCVAMPMPFWWILADYLATGALANISGQTEVMFTTNAETWARERARITSGGIGFGVFEVDGYSIPIVPDDQLGHTSVSVDGNPAITGDVLVLTRSFDGMTILAHEWLKLDAAKGLPEVQDYMFNQNGMIRTVWVTVNGTCYWYGMEMYARHVSLMQPLQARISDVTLETGGEYDMEAADWTHPDWYAFEGVQPYNDVALVSPLDAW